MTRQGVCLALIASGALALRLAGLGAPSLWHDEALELSRAAGNWSTVLLGRAIDQDPPLFALFNHVWISFGTDEWWLRLPAALLGAGAVYLAGAWSARRFGRRVGLLTALFMAVAPVLVYYAQELNQYAAMVFLTLAAWIAFEGVLGRGRPVDWGRFTGISVIALATHYGMAFPLAAMGVYLLWDGWRHRWRENRGWIGLYAAACAATLAILWSLGLGDRATLHHLQPRFGGTHLVKELDYLADKLWREVAVFFTLPFSGGPALWIAGTLVILALAGAAALWRAGPPGRRVVAVFFVGALALVYPADGMGWYPLGYRWALFAAPAFVVALAAGVAWLGREARGLDVTVAGVIVAIGLLFAPQSDVWNPWLALPREDMRPAVAELARGAVPGDTVYVSNGAEPAFRYYWESRDRQALSPDGPALVWGQDFTVEDAGGAAGEAARVVSALGMVGTAVPALADRRLWLVLARVEGGGDADLLAALASAGWVQADVAAFEGVTLVRVEPDRSPAH